MKKFFLFFLLSVAPVLHADVLPENWDKMTPEEQKEYSEKASEWKRRMTQKPEKAGGCAGRSTESVSFSLISFAAGFGMLYFLKRRKQAA